ncbi:hypothetical protein BDR06DRAFT_1062228 [Suillus hirtellus]|nr:hypothetical protein BDR06DRAFT_1062228 [Suillus hirtellus]
MSLLKITFLVASAIGMHISLTSPSLPLSPQEKMVPSASELFLQNMSLDPSSIEAANILAMHMGPSQIPDVVYGASALQFLRALHSMPITPAFLAGSLSVTVGGIFRRYCMSTLGKFWSFPLSVRKEHRIVTSGPYSIVRHPSYTSYLLQYIGIVITHGSKWSWMRQSGILQLPYMKVSVVIALLLFTAAIPLDKMLQRALGEDWEDWAKKVRYKLIPGIY